MRTLISIGACLFIVVAGVAAVMAITARAARAQVAPEPEPIPPALVRLQTVTPGVVEDFLPLTGRLDPWEERTISAETTGPVTWQGIQEGQRVRKGQEVVRVDTTPIRATHAQADARLRLAEEELRRLSDLREAGVASPQDLDRARTERNVAAAELAANDTRLDRSVIHAPLDGVIDRLFVREREFVDMGTALYRIVQVDRLKAVLPIPERDIMRFSEGDAVTVQVDALDGESFEGRIYRIAPTADRATRTFATEVEIDNAAGRLRPGMTVRAMLVRDRFENAVSIPLFCVLSMENQHFVAVERDGVAELRAVELGRVQGDRVHVRAGLAPGDHLIIEGHRDLRIGQPVRVADDAAA